MSVMAYREEFFGGGAGRQVPAATVASDTLAKPDPFGRPFQRPGPDVINEAIPTVFVGRNRDGLWVARDADGKFGGLFWRKQSALRFARRAAASTGCATVFPQARFELDIENAGSPLIAHAGRAMRFLTLHIRQLIYPIRKTLGF
jgi:hypothetical protein